MGGIQLEIAPMGKGGLSEVRDAAGINYGRIHSEWFGERVCLIERLDWVDLLYWGLCTMLGGGGWLL